jgi:DNA repair exonuclease SbcCD ATPase subunit/predicted MPP superfamily phosphohydrolase
MHVVNIGLDKIDRIYHIADVHIRNVKRHAEYELVFDRLYTYIKNTKTANSVIYVAGDVVHAKTDMSPELVHQVAQFFSRLADIAPMILIAGNHDCNLNNSNRLDALTPVVTALKHNNIHYFKDSGIYCTAGVHFNVMSVFDAPSSYLKASDFEGDYKIALHHGAIHNAVTDSNITLSNTHATIDLFLGHDLTLLGDIHKTQFLNEDKTIAYAGSLIQQNHAEDATHGILVWDLETRTAEFVQIENDFGYCTINIVNGKVIDTQTVVPKKPRMRLKIQDTNSADLKSIIAVLKHKYDIQEIATQKVNTFNTVSTEQRINFGDIRNLEWQNKIITDYLFNEFALDSELLDAVRYINRMVHTKLPDSDSTRNVVWVPKTFEFANMFSYGESNKIDFDNINGVNGLFAPNASGKSTLLDAIAFCCYDKCSRTSKAIHVLNNKKSSFEATFQFELGNRRYFIKRYGKKNNKGHVKVDVDFWYLDENNSVVLLNGDQRDSTNKNIRQYLGSYEDFVLTALSLQNNNTGFIDMAQRERKDLLSQFLDIDVFESQYQIANEEIRETASILKEYKRNDFSSVLAASQHVINEITSPLSLMQKKLASLEDDRDSLNDKVLTLTSELKHIDSDISDIQSISIDIVNTQDSINEVQEKIGDISNKIKAYEISLTTIQSKIDNTDIAQIKNNINIIEELHRQITIQINDLTKITKDIEHADSMMSKLQTHQWDPNCQYCMANPWLLETKLIADRLPQLHDYRDQLQDSIALNKQKINELQADSLYDQLSDYNKLLTDGKQLYNSLINTRQSLETQEVVLSNYQDKLTALNDLHKKANARKNDIDFNKHKNLEIETLKVELQDISNEIRELHHEILAQSGQLEIAKRDKQTAIDSINRMRTLELQLQAYEYYLIAIKRDGIPYELISKALPQIEAEINNILTQIVDFTITLETDGKNINGYIVYDNSNYWPLELTSGMEKFISSLAIRASLINITNLPKPNFLAIDEGFGVLDSDNLNSMYLLFDYLKTQFTFILCISHIDAMRDIVDKLIEIKKENSYSQINYA